MDHVGCLYRKRAKKQARPVATGRDRVEEIAFRLALMDSFLEWYNWYAPLNSVINQAISSPHPSSRQAKVSSENASLSISGSF